MVRIIVIDIDGTLLNDDKLISLNTLNMLKKAINKNIMIIPASGRPIKRFPKELMELDIKYAITSNGAVVWDVESKKMLARYEIDFNLAKRLIDILALEDAHVYCDYYADHIFTSYSKVNFHKNVFGDNVMFVDNLGDYLFNAKYSPEKIGIIFNNQQCEDRIEYFQILFPELTMVQTGTNSIEISALSVSKGSALMDIAGILNINREDIMVIGDSNNDIEMLKFAGISYAMGNAGDEVKKICSKVTSSNNDDGVAKAIMDII